MTNIIILELLFQLVNIKKRDTELIERFFYQYIRIN